MDKRQLALVGLIITSLLWSSVGVTTKLLLDTFDPLPLGFLRFFIASLTICPFIFFKWRKTIISHFWTLLVVGLFGTGNILFFYFGLRLTTASATAIIYTTTPLLVAIFSWIFIKEQITIHKVIGIVVGFLGVLLISLLPMIQTGTTISGNVWGNLLIICAVLNWTSYTIMSRKLMIEQKVNPFVLSSCSIFVSMIAFGIATWVTPHRDFVTPLFVPSSLLLLLHLSILLTVVTYVLYQTTIQMLSATSASLTNYIQPVFAILLNVIILNEVLTSGFIVGSLLVFFGVFLTTNPTQHAKNWLNNRRKNLESS